MEHKSLQKIADYFSNLHDNVVNQKYAELLPYSFHLEMVEKQFLLFRHLIPQSDVRTIISAVWAHDSMEDARLTYNDVAGIVGPEVAEIVYLCTDNRGRTRAERKNQNWYMELGQNKLAVFVKLCDVIANVKFSLLTNSKMFHQYKEEYAKYKGIIHVQEYDEMFVYLESLFSLPQNNKV